MDVWTVIRTTARHWYVSVPILLVTLGLGLVVTTNLGPVYSAKSSAVLTGPSLVKANGNVKAEKVNPFLDLGGSLYATQVISVLMDSEPKRLEFKARGLETDFKVDRVDAVLSFEVTGSDPDSVVKTSNTLVSIADSEMVKLQGGANVSASPTSRIRVVALAVPKITVPDRGAHAKLLAVFAVLGFVAANAAAILLDGFLRWRGARGSTQRATNAPRGIPHEFMHGSEARSDPQPAGREKA